MDKEQENKKLTVVEREEKVLAFWNKHKIFEKSLKKTKSKKAFVFYDGPPFATGVPHYGHLLTSFMKDAIPRYRTMKGNFVRRVWGWDCHGLPLENVVEKELGLEHKKDIERFGIEKFNETAKVSVLRYDADWKKMIPRVGRWVDMEQSYKTMDATYSESIWWAFKTLYGKKLIYKGFKPMHICPRCETTLAASEVTLNYKDITDISVTAKFELVDEPGTYVLAWTTTPWTLPGNVALAVNPDFEYVKVKDVWVEGEHDTKEPLGVETPPSSQKKTAFYILAKDRISEYKDKFRNYKPEIIQELKGKDLVGKQYKPLFDYYANDSRLPNRKNGWKIYPASFVTTESGTGIVHIAPAFGEDDLKLGEKYHLPFVQHVNMDGTFAGEVKDFIGMSAKPKEDHQKTDIEILKFLAGNGLLFSKEKITHSYPHCWRCDTPLLNYATSSWFVKVTALKKKLLAENNKVSWVPETMKHGRFGKWLAGARDWAISRSRFWGAPLPVWECDSCKSTKVVGSIKELQDNMKTSANRYFVMRHGEAESNVRNITSTDARNNSHLTERGKKQAAVSGNMLKKKHIDIIYASDFARTQETARIVAAQVGIPEQNIVLDERLREIKTGIYNHRSNTEYHAFFSSNEERFYKKPEGGENLSEVRKRVIDFLYELEQKHQGKTILIITHEYPSWMLAAGSRGATVKEAAAMKKEGQNFIKTGNVISLPFRPFPHNNDYELDVHRPYIDRIELVCPCGGRMKRIPDVFDCWFESGSMPYAQFHYPFENQKEFKKNFPADFISEGLDQTRGWFYNMLVLSIGLFGKTPFKNVIVNGLILAEDGQKMSKRLKNYPDPTDVVNTYGADALRYYLLSSPVVHGEDLGFSTKGVDEVQKKVIGRLLNVMSFYELYIDPSVKAGKNSKHILDQWILARLSETAHEVEQALVTYKLDGATRPIGNFVDDLSTWYLRRSRDRFKNADARGTDAQSRRKDKKAALSTTRFVLQEFSKVVAPVMPFIAEEVYQKVREKRNPMSVHLETWPESGKRLSGEVKRLLGAMTDTRMIVSLGLEARAKAGIKVRQPLATLNVKSEKLKGRNELHTLILDEVNVKEIIFNDSLKSEVEIDTTITPELKHEGQFRELVRNIQDLRKKENLTPRDHVHLEVKTGEHGESLIKTFEKDIKKICLLKSVTYNSATIGEEITIDNIVFVIRLKK